MLIVSKFHDYYDSAIGYGVDKTIVYHRIFDDKTYYKSASSWRKETWGKEVCEVKLFTIGFCGKLYPGVNIFKYQYGGTTLDRNIYSAQELEDFRISLGAQDRKRRRVLRGVYLDTRAGREDYFRVVESDDLFFKYKCPVFYKDSSGIKPNPRLKDFSFQKVKDSVTAFQDIMMYISGVLGVDQRPMVEISDEDKAHKKGHGGKYSFRTPPKG
jgi:hypothetical protein